MKRAGARRRKRRGRDAALLQSQVMEHAGVGVLDGGRYVFVPDGLIFASSNEGGGGLWILEYRPGVTGIVVWIADKKNVTVKYAEK